MIRPKSELVALEALVVALTRSLASCQPSLAKSLQATAEELRERYRHLAIRDSSPETLLEMYLFIYIRQFRPPD
jgi:hypothetical protein